MMNSHHSPSHLELPYSPTVSLATSFSNGFGFMEVGGKNRQQGHLSRLLITAPFGCRYQNLIAISDNVSRLVLFISDRYKVR